eukprot:CAMPEP_0180349118 /NCGR_PEP_ID=MMETSP0989-20121125/5296_1 /TAXON_ID=697907 /ORGANISM="non described non described, Strain CCMP2293" /LENGTH=330 /DNA_ID=CAMNT_0022338415 /DNA_START=119 /DNA_END=1108 /DNA_ORIENTATION=-
MTRMAALLRQSSQRMEDQDVLFLQAVFNRAAQIPYQFDAGVFCEFLLSAGELGVVPASTSLSAIVRRARELIDTSTDTQVATIIRTCSGWQNVALAEADGVTNVLSYWKVVPSPDLMRALRGDQGQETAEGRGHQGVAQGRWESPRRDGGDAGRGAGGVKGRDGSEGEARSPGVSSLEKRALGASRSAELRGLISKCSTEREVCTLAGSVGEFCSLNVVAEDGALTEAQQIFGTGGSFAASSFHAPAEAPIDMTEFKAFAESLLQKAVSTAAASKAVESTARSGSPDGGGVSAKVDKVEAPAVVKMASCQWNAHKKDSSPNKGPSRRAEP